MCGEDSVFLVTTKQTFENISLWRVFAMELWSKDVVKMSCIVSVEIVCSKDMVCSKDG